jgi:glycine/D-amino acid oxidase-like deaminating enzyme/nitrite reductase/ring-hydroxylating ferredoxin subunit
MQAHNEMQLPGIKRRTSPEGDMIRFAGKHGAVWSVEAPRVRFPRLCRDLAVDVAVVGAGITGLTAAWLLKKAGKSVAVLDLGELGSGATGRSSGHLTALPDRPLSRILADFGEAGAREVVRSGQEAIDQIESICAGGVEARFERVPGFRYSETEVGLQSLHEEAEAAARLGLPATFAEQVPLPFPVRGALRIEHQAQFHPLLYLEGLVEQVAGDGCHIFEHTKVGEIEEGAPCRVVAGSHVVSAGTVIEATHTPLNRSLGIQSRVSPYLTYVLGLRIKGEVPSGLFWDTAEPYHYLRRAKVGSGDCLLVGGADHKSGQEQDPGRHLEELLEYAGRRFTVVSTEWSWSQQVFESADGLPFVGRKPGYERVLVAGGYSGTGLTFGTLAGTLLSEMALGREVPSAPLYSPSRIKPLAAAKEFLRDNLNVAWHLVADRLKSHAAEGHDPLKPCQGRLMHVEGKNVAVYLDETSRLHVLSPTCPHAGGTVSWNDLEKTWDCPCHGGRFSPLGKVLASPPTQDLEVIPQSLRTSPTMVGP